MERLVAFSYKLVANVDSGFERYLHGQINWKNRLIGIVGPRGVGKTTLVLQYIKKQLLQNESLYITAEDIYFSDHRLIDLADRFTKNSGRYLIIDEIHKYPDWSKELKLMYDYHPELQIVFTGSSVLDIQKGSSDLSRRAVVYSMQGLSFREYLLFFQNLDVPVYTLKEVLEHKVNVNALSHPLPLFADYLKQGYFPFAIEDDYDIKLKQIINQTMETDIPIYAGMNVSTARRLKQLLAIIAKSVPFKPNMSKIAEIICASRNNIADYLMYIEEAGLIAQLRSEPHGIKSLGKLEKVYLDNTNLMYSIQSEPANKGTVRETFLFNQLRNKHKVYASKSLDVKVEGVDIEVGGKNKSQRQLGSSPNAYVVKDDIEYGYQNVIPLWHFGLMY